jgi:hypothetical protein
VKLFPYTFCPTPFVPQDEPSAYEVERANNIASNKRKLAELGINQPLPAKPAKPKAVPLGTIPEVSPTPPLLYSFLCMLLYMPVHMPLHIPLHKCYTTVTPAL